MYCYRIREYVGAHAAALGRLTALVFTAGNGESSDGVRAAPAQRLEGLGVTLSPKRNRASSGRPGPSRPPTATVAVLVCPPTRSSRSPSTLTVVAGSGAPSDRAISCAQVAHIHPLNLLSLLH